MQGYCPKNKKVSARLAMFLVFVLLLQGGCGTVVGNPKKPQPNNETPNPLVYKLPLIEFTVPDSAVTDTEETALFLNQGDSVDAGAGQKTILVSWAKRFDRSIKSINHLSERINRIIENERTTNKDDVLVFKGKGVDNKVSAKIRQLDVGGDYKFEAVLCYGDSPISHVLWSEDSTKLEVTRDFSPTVEQDTNTAELTSRLILDKSADSSLTIDFSSYGKSGSDLPDESGKGFVEHAVVKRNQDAEVSVKAVADVFAVEPTDLQFEGAYYLTGRMLPDATTGGKPYAQQFVAYYVGYKLLCKNGFDEDSENLWQPVVGEPRFCLGRPSGKKKFDSFQEFIETAADLQEIGILSKKSLAPVTISNELGCD